MSRWLQIWDTPEYQELKEQDINFVLEYFADHPPKKILDIGCGLAWESRAMQQNFGSELWLLDGDPQGQDTRKSEVGWRGDADNMSFYNSLEELDELLQQLGTENYHLVDANNIQIDEDVKFDLVYSAISCGFHYNANTYMDLIQKHSHENTKIIFDLRTKNLQQDNTIIKEILVVGRKHKKCLIEFSDEKTPTINTRMKIVLVTGGFDPLHSGHIRYFEEAKKLGDRLIVGVNSDAWLTRKKGRPFMPLEERANVIQALSMVDAVVAFEDDYDADGSCRRFIEDSCWNYEEDEVIFANGGDRTTGNIPEMEIVAENLSFEFGVGGTNKANSSSWILEEWKAPRTERPWGYYRVLHEEPGVKVKELAVDPGKKLSMQRHSQRSEYWLVSAGIATVSHQHNINSENTITTMYRHQELHIPVGAWHQLQNNGLAPVKIIEIQYGEDCREEDIERQNN